MSAPGNAPSRARLHQRAHTKDLTRGSGDGFILKQSISVPRPEDKPSKIGEDLKALWEKQLDDTPTVRVSKTLSNPHALVARIVERRAAEARRWSLSPLPYSSKSSGAYLRLRSSVMDFAPSFFRTVLSFASDR